MNVSICLTVMREVINLLTTAQTTACCSQRVNNSVAQHPHWETAIVWADCHALDVTPCHATWHAHLNKIVKQFTATHNLSTWSQTYKTWWTQQEPNYFQFVSDQLHIKTTSTSLQSITSTWAQSRTWWIPGQLNKNLDLKIRVRIWKIVHSDFNWYYCLEVVTFIRPYQWHDIHHYNLWIDLISILIRVP